VTVTTKYWILWNLEKIFDKLKVLKEGEQMTENTRDEFYDFIEKAKEQTNNFFTMIEEHPKLTEVEVQKFEILYDRLHSLFDQMERLVDYSS
jgi:hypothetical protein